MSSLSPVNGLTFLAVIAAIAFGAGTASADNGAGNGSAVGAATNTPAVESNSETGSPRYRMADPVDFDSDRRDRTRIEREPTESDFAWNNITKNSPASGQDPVIGSRLKHSFYDFRDGFDLPKYVAGPKTN